jgi:hypothetical protein
MKDLAKDGKSIITLSDGEKKDISVNFGEDCKHPDCVYDDGDNLGFYESAEDPFGEEIRIWAEMMKV